MQNWRPDKDQDEEEKRIRNELHRRKQAENDEEARTPPNNCDEPRCKNNEDEGQQDAGNTTPARGTSLSDSESKKKRSHPADIEAKKQRQRVGTRSVPGIKSRRRRRHTQQTLPIKGSNEDDSQKSSVRTVSASTQHSMRSALSLSMTQDDPNESLRTLDDDSAPEVNAEAIRRLEEFSNETVAQPIAKFVKEYNKSIKSIVPTDRQVEAFKNNKKKNRYADVFCLDSTRVILRDPDGQGRREGNYIHANYVSSDELHRTYILAQGPKKETVVDFWHMVWQVQCPVIVMLCDYTEGGKKKCVQYLPPRNSTVQVQSSTGKMAIRTSEGKKHSRGKLVETDLILTEDGKDLKVKHWKYTGWGDFKAPTEFQTIFRLLKEIRHTERGFPIIHCSAGVGRSGTFIALEVCLAVLRSGKPLNIMSCVETVRRQRAHSVQTSLQYVFLFRALLEMSAINDVITESQLKNFRVAYENLSKKI